MNKRRNTFENVPNELQQLHQEWGGPMLVLDYWVTRRQRLHSLYMPGEPHPITDTGLFQVMDMADLRPGQRVLVTTIDAAGTIHACFADFHPYHPEESSNG